jgi:hypothetical protein
MITRTTIYELALVLLTALANRNLVNSSVVGKEHTPS